MHTLSASLIRPIIAMSTSAYDRNRERESIGEDQDIHRSSYRLLISYLIGLSPFNALRCFLYRHLLGYNIYNARIGWLTTICVADATLDRCCIKKRNCFIGPMTITILKDAAIDSGNVFECGWWVLEKQYDSANYGRTLTIGKNSRIGSKHHFDIVGSLTIGDRTSIAGLGSQFWTHGAGVKDRNIAIGDDCYIGAGVLFSPGSSIHNNTIVALGSVVTRAFHTNNLMLGGVPAAIIKDNYCWRTV